MNKWGISAEREIQNQMKMVELKNITLELKNSFNGLIGRFQLRKDCKLEDRIIEIIQTEMQKKKKKSERNRTEHPTTETIYPII